MKKSGREDEVECANLRVFSICVLALGPNSYKVLNEGRKEIATDNVKKESKDHEEE